MTLYMWIHWFWITISIYCLRETSPLSTNMVSTEAQTMTSISDNIPHRPGKPVGNQSNIPPIALPTASKKLNITRTLTFRNIILTNNTRKQLSNVTDSNSAGTTVIDDNFITPISNASDNEMINSSINAINVTYIGIENNTYIPHLGQPQANGEETSPSNLSAAGITGITMGCVSVVGIICAVSYFIYRNRGFNKPQVLNDRYSNPDSSVYIDDMSVRDNSDEMYSLDNDSFLNSLEAMTIQNYWTDTVKHTKL